jgi:hypothetical protein
MTRPRDLPVERRRCDPRCRKRRWRCDQAGCPRRSFTESLPAIPPRARPTVRLRESTGASDAAVATSTPPNFEEPRWHAPVAPFGKESEWAKAVSRVFLRANRLGDDFQCRGLPPE